MADLALVMRIVAKTLGNRRSHFASKLRYLRVRFVGKQLCLSHAVGCSDAAVSFWESGKRLPQRRAFFRILNALASGGASRAELSHLRASWAEARMAPRCPCDDCDPDSSRKSA